MWQIVAGVALGALAMALAVTYWDKIKEWLNTIVANRIEDVFGYGARKRVHHAVTIVDRFMDGVRERAFVYVQKKNGIGYDKYAETRKKVIIDVEADVVKELNENGPVIQEFTYME